MPIKSARPNHSIFRQLCELIPPYLVPKLANSHGVVSQIRNEHQAAIL
jgi:hypothetical protein